MRKFVLTLLLFISPLLCIASQVDTLWIHSDSMNKDIQTVVIYPESATKNSIKRYPVVYLLHGYSGDAFSWLKIKPSLKLKADNENLIFVCPDAENSWYLDSPFDDKSKYETFCVKELLPYIDKKYPTKANRKGRAITGLSMGGHGALYLAIRHTNLFGAAGSTSGGVDFTPFPRSWQLSQILGEYKSHKKLWKNHTVISQIDKIQSGDLKLIIDCGINDFFLEVNKELHEELNKLKIDHDFIIRPGEHNSKYWNNSIDYQLLFFKKYFK